jgi:hypothetical protein
MDALAPSLQRAKRSEFVPKHHFMVDLETMSTKPNAAIVSIGIVQFDRAAEIVDKFYTPVSLASCRDFRLHTEASTVRWWDQQDATVKAHWNVESPPDLPDAMKATQDWLFSRAGSRKNVCPWGNGADFDMPILRSGFDAVGADEPWMFYNVHCFRTVKNLYPLDIANTPARVGHHRADADAEYQVACLRAIMHQYGLPTLLSFGG